MPRQKGSLNKVTADLREVLASVIGKRMKNLDALLDALEPKEQADLLTKLLPFLIPKLQIVTVEPGEEFNKRESEMRAWEMRLQLQAQETLLNAPDIPEGS